MSAPGPPVGGGTEPPASGDPLVAAPIPYPPRAVAYAKLDRFLVGKGPVQIREVPWPLDRRDILEYVRERLEQGQLSPLAASRVPLLAEAYLLEELPALLAPHLAGREASAEDVWRSGSLCAAIGVVGDPPQRGAAVPYYEHLVRHAAAGEVLPELLAARDALGPFAESGSLREAMNARAATLVDGGDYDQEVEGQDLEDLAANTLEDIDWADEARARFQQIPGDDERLAFLLDIYLERAEYGGEEFLLPWSVREIRRQAHRRGAEPVLAALTRELAGTAEARGSDEDAAFTAVRLMRAVLYFGRDLEDEELEFLEEHQDDQKDPLSVESLLPEPEFDFLGAE